MDVSLWMPDYIMIHTFTSFFLYYHFEKVKMKLFHSPTNSSQGRGKSKLDYNDSQNIPGLYFKCFTIFLKILWKPFFKEKQCRCDKKYFSGRVNLRLNNDCQSSALHRNISSSVSIYLSLSQLFFCVEPSLLPRICPLKHYTMIKRWW